MLQHYDYRVKVDKAIPTDLYEQVAAEIRRAIADGKAKPGERLPPAKDLAAVLDVNTNTVLRTLRLLHDEGLPRVPTRPRHLGRRHTRTQCSAQQGREFVELARRRHGYSVDEVVRTSKASPEPAAVELVLCVVRGQAMRTRGVKPQGPFDPAHFQAMPTTSWQATERFRKTSH